MVSYAAMVLFSGAGALRDASGNVTDLILKDNNTVAGLGDIAACANTTEGCQYGLHNSYSVCNLDYILISVGYSGFPPKYFSQMIHLTDCYSETEVFYVLYYPVETYTLY